MSRTFWVVVGAAGGIYAYRRGQRAVTDAKERGFVGNVQVATDTVASVAQGASKLVSLASGQHRPVVVEYEYLSQLPSNVRVTPVRRTSWTKQRVSVPSTAMRLDALRSAPPVDVREAPGRRAANSHAG
jgi:hypothetical protein